MNQNRIKKIIKESGLTLTNVAKRLNVTRQSIENWNKTDKEEDYLKVKEAIAQYIVVDEYSIERFNNLENEVKELKDLVIQLTKDNSNLREENWRLRVLCAQSGGLDSTSKKIKG